MYVRVHSVDDIRDGSRGKTVRVNGYQCEMKASSDELTVTAVDEDLIGTGDRAGTPKLIKRNVAVSFTAQEVKRLVDEALSSGLLTATSSGFKSKKSARGMRGANTGQIKVELSIQLVPRA